MALRGPCLDSINKLSSAVVPSCPSVEAIARHVLEQIAGLTGQGWTKDVKVKKARQTSHPQPVGIVERRVPRQRTSPPTIPLASFHQGAKPQADEEQEAEPAPVDIHGFSR